MEQLELATASGKRLNQSLTNYYLTQSEALGAAIMMFISGKDSPADGRGKRPRPLADCGGSGGDRAPPAAAGGGRPPRAGRLRRETVEGP